MKESGMMGSGNSFIESEEAAKESHLPRKRAKKLDREENEQMLEDFDVGKQMLEQHKQKLRQRVGMRPGGEDDHWMQANAREYKRRTEEMRKKYKEFSDNEAKGISSESAYETEEDRERFRQWKASNEELKRAKKRNDEIRAKMQQQQQRQKDDDVGREV